MKAYSHVVCRNELVVINNISLYVYYTSDKILSQMYDKFSTFVLVPKGFVLEKYNCLFRIA